MNVHIMLLFKVHVFYSLEWAADSLRGAHCAVLERTLDWVHISALAFGVFRPPSEPQCFNLLKGTSFPTRQHDGI